MSTSISNIIMEELFSLNEGNWFPDKLVICKSLWESLSKDFGDFSCIQEDSGVKMFNGLEVEVFEDKVNPFLKWKLDYKQPVNKEPTDG